MKTFFKKNGKTQKDKDSIIPSDLYVYKETDEIKNRRLTKTFSLPFKENALFYGPNFFIK